MQEEIRNRIEKKLTKDHINQIMDIYIGKYHQENVEKFFFIFLIEPEELKFMDDDIKYKIPDKNKFFEEVIPEVEIKGKVNGLKKITKIFIKDLKFQFNIFSEELSAEFKICSEEIIEIN